MKVLRYLLVIACCVIVCASLATADSIQLRSGRHLQGKFIGGTSTAIGFMTAGAIEYFATTEVLAIVFDSATDSSLGGLQQNSLKGPRVSGRAKLRRVNRPVLPEVERSQRSKSTAGQ